MWLRSSKADAPPALLCMALAATLSGCGSDVNQQSVVTGLTLDCQVFQSTTPNVGVNRIFDLDLGGRTCSASGCHSVFGSSGGAFKIYPNAEPNTFEMQANYLAAKGFANLDLAENSKLLLEPLAGAQSIVGPHTGGDIFPDSDDTHYRTIYRWIAARIQGPSKCFP